MSNRDRRSLLPIAIAGVMVCGCTREKPVPAVDVAPVLAAVVNAVDGVVGPRDSVAIDPRILPPRSAWQRKEAATAWSEAQLAATIGPRHPRLELGKMAYTCPVTTPGCVARRNLPVVALSMPVVHRDTVVVEAMFAGRRSNDMINEIHWLWFAVRKDSSWRVVKHTTLDHT